MRKIALVHISLMGMPFQVFAGGFYPMEIAGARSCGSHSPVPACWNTGLRTHNAKEFGAA
jgi:hypothetical protein